MKIRLQGTNSQIEEMLNLLREQLGDRIRSVSKPYKDRSGNTYRVYVEVQD